MTDQPPSPTAELTSADSAAVARVLGRMPYLPLVSRADKMRPRTVADLAETLDALAEVLARYGAQANETEEELRRLRSDISATRRLFGLPRLADN